MSKGYGLILPGKKTENVPPPKADFTKPSIFDNESSSSDEGKPTKLPKMKSMSIGPGAAERRQARMVQKKALAEDPTVFQYDELYDEIESKREEEKQAKSSEVKKPKYISRLLQQAERRKLENERRIERMVQKEREAEGEQFKDKESYVTQAYRKKLEEIKQAEEEEKREDYLEAIGDVRKQGNLDGFYRHLYEQKLGPKEKQEKDKTEKVEEKNKDSEIIDTSNKIKTTKPRTYRKRQSSDDETEEVSDVKKSHIQSNLDADSDFSIDSSSDEESGDEKNKSKDKNESDKVKPVEIKQEIDTDVLAKENKESESKSDSVEVKVEKNKDEETVNDKVEVKKPKKEKVDIWKKRTVGDVFDAALKRYYERKSAKSG